MREKRMKIGLGDVGGVEQQDERSSLWDRPPVGGRTLRRGDNESDPTKGRIHSETLEDASKLAHGPALRHRDA